MANCGTSSNAIHEYLRQLLYIMDGMPRHAYIRLIYIMFRYYAVIVTTAYINFTPKLAIFINYLYKLMTKMGFTHSQPREMEFIV